MMREFALPHPEHEAQEEKLAEGLEGWLVTLPMFAVSVENVVKVGEKGNAEVLLGLE
jgi:hypothetical protein